MALLIVMGSGPLTMETQELRTSEQIIPDISGLIMQVKTLIQTLIVLAIYLVERL
jgi:hypothetical protein